MTPKDEDLFGITEIYLDEEKVSLSNPFGFSTSAKSVDRYNETTSTFTLKGSLSIPKGVGDLFCCKEEYNDMICTHIDGFKYSFSNGQATIITEFRKLTDEIREIKIGSKYSIEINQ